MKLRDRIPRPEPLRQKWPSGPMTLLLLGAGAILGALMTREVAFRKKRRLSGGAGRTPEAPPGCFSPSFLPQADRLATRPGHERSDLPVAALAAALVLAACAALIMHGALWEMLRAFDVTPKKEGVKEEVVAPAFRASSHPSPATRRSAGKETRVP